MTKKKRLDVFMDTILHKPEKAVITEIHANQHVAAINKIQRLNAAQYLQS